MGEGEGEVGIEGEGNKAMFHPKDVTLEDSMGLASTFSLLCNERSTIHIKHTCTHRHILNNTHKRMHIHTCTHTHVTKTHRSQKHMNTQTHFTHTDGHTQTSMHTDISYHDPQVKQWWSSYVSETP